MDILSFSADCELELNRRTRAVVGSSWDNLSMEYGVLIGSDGRGSKCLEIRESLACGGAMRGRLRRATTAELTEIWLKLANSSTILVKERGTRTLKDQQKARVGKSSLLDLDWEFQTFSMTISIRGFSEVAGNHRTWTVPLNSEIHRHSALLPFSFA